MKKIRVGVFGLWMRAYLAKVASELEGVEVVAICDRDEKRVESFLKRYPDFKGQVFSSFDEFIECGLDAVFLFNYFNEHAKYAIRCMEKGIHVLSECTSAVTLKECVELCEAVEKSGCIYCIGENYPFTAAGFEMKRVVQGGTLGRILYAESEYNHPFDSVGIRGIAPYDSHWRLHIPPSYYITHTLGPLMYYTDQMPLKVSATAVQSYVKQDTMPFNYGNDAFAMMSVITDDGALFRFPAWSSMASPNGTRLCGENGSIETGRAIGKDVFLFYERWCIPEGKEARQQYTPEFETNADASNKTGHGGGDFWIVYNFIEAIKKNEQPYFDVYRGCAMSATAILAWRSILHNGETYDIPDFKNKEEREKYRDDDLSPFLKENGERDPLPRNTVEAMEMGYKVALPKRKK